MNEAEVDFGYLNKTIELIGVRNIKFDLQVEEMNYDGRHLKPSDIEELLKKKREKEEKQR